jgi:hypothetical protein
LHFTLFFYLMALRAQADQQTLRYLSLCDEVSVFVFTNRRTAKSNITTMMPPPLEKLKGWHVGWLAGLQAC